MVEQFALLDEEHLVFLAVMGALALGALTIIASVIAVQLRKLRQ